MHLPQIGTYQMAVCSKAHNKPFYVVAESFKFVRLYPLNQQDVPDRFKVGALFLDFFLFYFFKWNPICPVQVWGQ